MSNLKRLVLIFSAVLVGVPVLLILITVLGATVGFLWTLSILSVLAVGVALILARKVSKETGIKIGSAVAGTLICVWGVVGITKIATPMFESNMSAPTQTAKTYDDVSAYVEAQAILKRYLKSPSTAAFPSMSSATIERLANDGFKVSSYVDAQNSFGAAIRNDWMVLFEFTDDGKVNIYQVIFGGEEVFRRDGLE